MNKNEIENKVDAVLKETFQQYEVVNVPDIENQSEKRLTLGNTGFLGEYSFLYADMRGSSFYTDQHRLQTITKIYKAYHHCMIECIKEYNGSIRSFDGDRVLAVFAGNHKINNSVNCAMKMAGSAYTILRPKIKSAFSNDNFAIGIGISTGYAMVSKAGVGYDRNNRDLIWIGDPPNLGSKLSDEADSIYPIYICKETFNGLSEANRFTTNNGQKIDMWHNVTYNFKGKVINVYKSNYYRSL